MAVSVGSAPRSVLLLDSLPPPPSAHPLLYPHRGGRGGPVLSTPINQHDHYHDHHDQQLPNGAVRNKRAAGGGALLNFGQKLYVQCEHAGPGGSVGLSQAGGDTERKKRDPPGQAVPVPVPRPRADGRACDISILGL